MSQKLVYPTFGVVFIQTFSIRHEKEFFIPKKGKQSIITPLNRDIEEQIFILPKDSPYEKDGLGNVARFSLRGFDFTLPIWFGKDQKTSEQLNYFSGRCHVEMNLFYGHLVSITYRFLFNNEDEYCKMTNPAETDHIITLLSTWLNGEHWNKDNEEQEARIDLHADFDVTSIWLDEDGNPLLEKTFIDNSPEELGRCFDKVAVRYKRFIYNHCTRNKYRSQWLTNKRVEQDIEWDKNSVEDDSHYAMVDVGEDVMHWGPRGGNLFAGLKEDAVVHHIREEHKAELIGLLTLYPREWKYRDSSDYDEVCGGSIAIDTDDLVLAGSSVCLVLGTYGRRGEGKETDWENVLKETLREYQVRWPEYLLILQFLLARQYLLDYVSDQLVNATLEMEKRSPERMLERSANLSVRLMRLLVQLDVVKFAKYPSHIVMYNRTAERLGIADSQERTDALISQMATGLNNIKDLQSARRENTTNLILAFVSVFSAFQLFYARPEMHFLEELWPNFPLGNAGAIIILLVAAISIYALLHIIYTLTLSIINRFKK